LRATRFVSASPSLWPNLLYSGELKMPTLADAVGGKDRVIGGPFGSKLTQADYTPVGVPVIRGSNMEAAGRYLGGEYAFISEAKLQRDLASNIAKPGDIVVTQRGTLGQVGIIPSKPFDRYVISQSQLAISCDTSKCSALFVYYFLRSPQFLSYLEAETIQVGVPHINLGLLRNVTTQWPQLAEQENIAATLGALDDKIELSRRMNETLGAMARAIFKDWFVDFGPTRAKAEGRAPYLTPEIWALFPDRLDDDDKPEGWKDGCLGDVARSVGESAKPNEMSPDTPYIGLEHMPRRSIALNIWEGAGKVTSGKLASFYSESFAHIFTKSESLRSTASVPRILLFLARRRPVPQRLSYPASRPTNSSHIPTKHQMPRTSWEVMARYPLCLPSEHATKAFQLTVAAMLDRIIANIHEARSLANNRDLLLPKLMSGEICLREAEKIVEAAA
jgi:type I restriction enzyme, S subunit